MPSSRKSAPDVPMEPAAKPKEEQDIKKIV
jgi:hypothetical protein